MEIIKVKKTFEYQGSDRHVFNEKGRYVIARDLMMQLPRENYEQIKVDEIPKEYTGEDLNGKSILILNLFALGDSSMFTPIIRYLKERYPKSHIIMERRPGYNLLEGNPYIDEFVDTPVSYSKFKSVDYYVDCYEYVGTYPYNYLNLVDFWSAKFRIFDLKDKNPVIVVKEEAKQYIKPLIEEVRQKANGKKLMLVHMIASSAHRCVPPELVSKIINKLEDEYVFITAHPKWEAPAVDVATELYDMRVENLSHYMEKPWHLVACIDEVDAVISADTVVPHIAAALKKPCVVICGPTAPEAQHFPKLSYETAHPVYGRYVGETCTSPCLIHAMWGPCQEAKNKGKFYSPCFDNVDPEEVVQKLKTIIYYIENKEKDLPTSCPICDYKGDYFEEIERSFGYRVWECPSCNSYFSLPREKRGSIEKLYEQSKFDPIFDTSGIKDIDVPEKLGLSMVNYIYTYPTLRFFLPNIKNILEIGATNGRFLYLAKLIGLDAIGIVPSSKRTADIKKEINLELYSAKDIEDIIEKNKNSIDFLFLNNIVGFLEYPKEFIEYVSKALSDNGFLVITFPNKNRPFYKIRKGIDWNEEEKDYSVSLNRISSEGMRELLRNAGFKFSYINSTPILPGDIYSILGLAQPLVINQQVPNNQSPQQITINPKGMETYVYNYLKPILNSYFLENQEGFAIASKKPFDTFWLKRLVYVWELMQLNVMRRDYILKTYL